jgi:predicted transcriptional regulator
MTARPKRREQPGQLSPSEWEIMRICWKLGRATVRDMLREDLKHRNRDYRTILTFAGRIAKKGYLTVELEGNTNYYTPAIPLDEGLQREIDRFLNDVVGSDPTHIDMVRKALDRKTRPTKMRRIKRG